MFSIRQFHIFSQSIEFMLKYSMEERFLSFMNLPQANQKARLVRGLASFDENFVWLRAFNPYIDCWSHFSYFHWNTMIYWMKHSLNTYHSHNTCYSKTPYFIYRIFNHKCLSWYFPVYKSEITWDRISGWSIEIFFLSRIDYQRYLWFINIWKKKKKIKMKGDLNSGPFI